MMTQPSHADLQSDLKVLIERVETNGRQAREGFETVNARLAVIEAKVLAYDLLKARVLGAIAAGALALSGLWWILHAKIEAALK